MGIRKFSFFIIVILFVSLMGGCASRVLKYEKTDELKNIQEFEDAVKIETPESSPPSPPTPPETKKIKIVKIEKKKPVKLKKQPKQVKPKRRLPLIESEEGFIGRRPIVDPMRVGEKIVHKVSYFGMSAGTLSLETKGLAQVNGQESYHFRIGIKSSPVFSRVYSVDDYVDTMLDYEELIPSVFTLHVRETKQLRESRAFFDHHKNEVTVWEKKVSKESGEENTKQQWTTQPYTQNVFSAIFYMRFFTWKVGGENAFWVANDNENVIFRGKALRQEHIKTDVGEFDAIVVKPEIELPGKFNPVGDIFIWLSKDEHKYVLRIESKIKIGTLVSEIIELDRGAP